METEDFMVKVDETFPGLRNLIADSENMVEIYYILYKAMNFWIF